MRHDGGQAMLACDGAGVGGFLSLFFFTFSLLSCGCFFFPLLRGDWCFFVFLGHATAKQLVGPDKLAQLTHPREHYPHRQPQHAIGRVQLMPRPDVQV